MNQGPIEIELREDGEAGYNVPPHRQPRSRQKWEAPMYEDFLPPQYSGMNLPLELSQLRNLTIKALMIQLVCIFAGFVFYFARRMSLYLIVNLLSLIFIYFGSQGVLKLEKWKIAAHSVFSMGVIGIFWLYLVLEALFMREIGDVTAAFKLSERWTMFLLALPYLIDLICGCISMYLTYYIFKLEDTKERLNKKNYNQMPEDIFVHEGYVPDSELCCVCLNFKKGAVIYPCGHSALCNFCAQDFKAKRVQRCPICRTLIKDIINIYA